METQKEKKTALLTTAVQLRSHINSCFYVQHLRKTLLCNCGIKTDEKEGRMRSSRCEERGRENTWTPVSVLHINDSSERERMKRKKNMIKYCFYLLMRNKSTTTIHLQHIYTLCLERRSPLLFGPKNKTTTRRSTQTAAPTSRMDKCRNGLVLNEMRVVARTEKCKLELH